MADKRENDGYVSPREQKGTVLKSADWSDCPLCTFADDQLLSPCLLHEKIFELHEDLGRAKQAHKDEIVLTDKVVEHLEAALKLIVGPE